MKKIVIFTILLTLFSVNNLLAQVGINTTNSAPDASAALDVDFTDKGVLIPRVSLTEMGNEAPVSSPATGLLVYNTATQNDVTPGYYYWEGSSWRKFITPKKKQIIINAYSAGYDVTLDISSRSVFIEGELTATASRGVHLLVISGNTGQVIYSQNYDTHADTNNGIDCANDINTYNTNNNVLIITTWDQPNKIHTDLSNAFKNVMQSKLIVNQTQDYRGAFCIIYQDGRGRLAEDTSNGYNDTGDVVGNGDTANATAACHVVTYTK